MPPQASDPDARADPAGCDRRREAALPAACRRARPPTVCSGWRTAALLEDPLGVQRWSPATCPNHLSRTPPWSTPCWPRPTLVPVLLSARQRRLPSCLVPRELAEGLFGILEPQAETLPRTSARGRPCCVGITVGRRTRLAWATAGSTDPRAPRRRGGGATCCPRSPSPPTTVASTPSPTKLEFPAGGVECTSVPAVQSQHQPGRPKAELPVYQYRVSSVRRTSYPVHGRHCRIAPTAPVSSARCSARWASPRSGFYPPTTTSAPRAGRRAVPCPVRPQHQRDQSSVHDEWLEERHRGTKRPQGGLVVHRLGDHHLGLCTTEHSGPQPGQWTREPDRDVVRTAPRRPLAPALPGDDCRRHLRAGHHCSPHSRCTADRPGGHLRPCGVGQHRVHGLRPHGAPSHDTAPDGAVGSVPELRGEAQQSPCPQADRHRGGAATTSCSPGLISPWLRYGHCWLVGRPMNVGDHIGAVATDGAGGAITVAAHARIGPAAVTSRPRWRRPGRHPRRCRPRRSEEHHVMGAQLGSLGVVLG